MECPGQRRSQCKSPVSGTIFTRSENRRRSHHVAGTSQLGDEVRQTGRTVYTRSCAQAPGPGVTLRAAVEGFTQGSSRSWFA